MILTLHLHFLKEIRIRKIVFNQVGREMVTSTDDCVLRQDMPAALQKVESAAKLLEEAAKMSQVRLIVFYFLIVL
jgi:hypothetical protein